jgi:hypothetical protein
MWFRLGGVRALRICSALVLAVTVASVTAAPAAWAQQTDQVTITGPGLAAPVTVAPSDEASSAQLDLLRQGSGINAVMVRELPGRFAGSRPPARLGLCYRFAWRVPGSGEVVQDVYPYATPSPIVYTPPQELAARHGWFEAPSSLPDTMRSVGLALETPAGAPPAASDSPGRGTAALTIAIAVLGAAALAFAAVAVVRRRR